MRLLALFLALVGCSDGSTTILDAAPPPPVDISGRYVVRVETLGIPQDPCICGDWCEADEYKTLEVTRDGDQYMADFASSPGFLYNATLVGQWAGDYLELPELVWDDQRYTSVMRLEFEGTTVGARFVFFNDALGASFEKRLSGQRL